MFSNVEQEKMPSIGRILVGLGRPSLPTSKRPPVHCGPTMGHAILGTSIYRFTNVGPPHNSGNPLT
jgi:hypothetical protein